LVFGKADLWVRFFLDLVFGLGGLWADQALVVLGEYPFFLLLRLAVPLLQRVTFADAQK